MPIIVAAIPTNLVTNFLLSLVCLFGEMKSNNQIVLKQVSGLLTRNISVFLDIMSRALLPKAN